MTPMNLPLAADATSFADRLRDFLFDIGLPPDLLVVGLVAAGLVFAVLGGIQALVQRIARR